MAHDIVSDLSVLDPHRFLKAASEVAGLSDFGDDGFREPFARFIESSRNEIAFSKGGLAGFEGDVMRVLINRLRMQADFAAHPEIFDEDVSDPIFVVGLVRTGTTKLQRMLGADPGLQSVPLWQMLFPAPFPGTRGQKPDPRLAFCRQAGGFAEGPTVEAIQTAHEMNLEAPDEDIILFEHSFEHIYLYLRNRIDSYRDWLRGRSMRPAYELYRRLLQYFQWQNGGRRDRPWVLKTTSHVAELELLLELFPKATIVNCHRDPYDCVRSYSRLQQLVWSLRESELPAPVVGRAMMDVWGDVMRRSVDARSRVSPNARILDVRYDDIKDSALDVIRSVNEMAGRELTPVAVKSMQVWERENQQHKFGRHNYSTADFGISRSDIEREFAPYLERYSCYL